MIEELLEQLIDSLAHTWHGKYRGSVARNDDPEGLGRIQAYVPRLLGEETTGWAMPCAPYAGPDQGFFTVPEPGSGVWIEFEGGDLSRPIWSGMWWGAPTEDDVAAADSTAGRHSRANTEVPQHQIQNPPLGPGTPAEPGVRILKSASGHHIVLDDRPDHRRIEIHDAHGNRFIFDRDGLTTIVSNERVDNTGARTVEVLQDDTLTVSGSQSISTGEFLHEIEGSRTVKASGTLTETARGGNYSRTVGADGVTIKTGGPLTERISGRHSVRVTGATQISSSGGGGISAGRGFNVSSLGSVGLHAMMPELPSLNAVEIDAVLGNVSINTFVGMLRLGGMTAISPVVLGDGLAIHHTMLALLSRAYFPPAALAYGPAMDIWAAMTVPLDLSMFAFVKRYPVG